MNCFQCSDGVICWILFLPLYKITSTVDNNWMGERTRKWHSSGTVAYRWRIYRPNRRDLCSPDMPRSCTEASINTNSLYSLGIRRGPNNELTPRSKCRQAILPFPRLLPLCFHSGPYEPGGGAYSPAGLFRRARGRRCVASYWRRGARRGWRVGRSPRRAVRQWPVQRVPELDGGGSRDDGLLCGGDVLVGVLWGGEWYDGVLELDGGVG
jgi:hypothetical protein